MAAPSELGGRFLTARMCLGLPKKIDVVQDYTESAGYTTGNTEHARSFAQPAAAARKSQKEILQGTAVSETLLLFCAQ